MNLFNCLFKCEEIIGFGGKDYLSRWIIIPKNRFFNIYLHRFSGSDLRCYHDHPWYFLSVVLWGSYKEYTPKGFFHRNWGSMVFRKPTHFHYIEIDQGKVCWTLFVTGWRCKEWGFLVNNRWVPWKEFEEEHSLNMNDLVRK